MKNILFIFFAIFCLTGCVSFDEPIAPLYSAEFNDEEYVWDDWTVTTNLYDWIFQPWNDGL